MILTYNITFGTPIRLALAADWGPRVELEALEFCNAAPVDWRIAPYKWREGLHAGHPVMRGFHNLQIGVPGGTRGIPGASVVIETWGIGEGKLHVWLRIGTFPESGACGS